jgi:hypothetical protein
MQITITKGQAEDRIAIVLANGRQLDSTFPKKGFIPHDAVHLFVERELGLNNAFWGMVASGNHPEEIASASRNTVPDAAIVELLQAERIVECFEADQWSGSSSAVDDLIAMAAVACNSSHVPLPDLDGAQVAAIRAQIIAFAQDWMAAPLGHVARFEWE